MLIFLIFKIEINNILFIYINNMDPSFRLIDFNIKNDTLVTATSKRGDKKQFMIQMFGMDEEGKTYAVLVKGFEPFFYVKVPMASKWNESKKRGFVEHIRKEIGEYYCDSVTKCSLIKRKKLYGFDKPIGERLFDWIYKLFTFQFGDSYFHHRKVIDLVKEKLPVSASLGIISFFLTYLVCIPLGIRRAVTHGSRFDLMAGGVVLFGYSIPGFILGVFLLILFGGGSFWNLFPIKGLTSENFADMTYFQQILDYLHHLILPTICMTIGSFSGYNTLRLSLNSATYQYVFHP